MWELPAANRKLHPSEQVQEVQCVKIETMTRVEKQIELRDKILIGLEKVYERLIEFKKEKNSELVILRGNKVVKIKP